MANFDAGVFYSQFCGVPSREWKDFNLLRGPTLGTCSSDSAVLSSKRFLGMGNTPPGTWPPCNYKKAPLGAGLRAVEAEDCEIFSPLLSPALCP